ncbi:malectin domain-containing carbohydrate-binding protein [Streptomyces corynorhini]|nr:malectin domain-containing carbohydrate-binding protein [Streptomyces corynorhini]
MVAALTMLSLFATGAAPAQAATHADSRAAAHADGVSIDVGGSGDATFIADTYGTGGITDSKPDNVASLPNWSRTVSHPIPAEIWHTARHTESSYSVPDLTPGATYEVRLYFMDWYFTRAPKQRIFDVAINGTKVLTDFDIRGTLIDEGADGAAAFGLEKDFQVTVPADGTVTLDFIRGAANQPQINAIAIVPATE